MTRKKAIAKLVTKDNEEPTYRMSTEVRDWIERANSLIKFQENQIEALKTELKELKAYKVWASKKLTQVDFD